MWASLFSETGILNVKNTCISNLVQCPQSSPHTINNKKRILQNYSFNQKFPSSQTFKYSFSLQLIHSQQSSKDLVRQTVMLLSESFHISCNFLQCFGSYLLSSCYDLCLSMQENKVRTPLPCLEGVVINNFPVAIYNERHISLFSFVEFVAVLLLFCVLVS